MGSIRSTRRAIAKKKLGVLLKSDGLTFRQLRIFMAQRDMKPSLSNMIKYVLTPEKEEE